MTFKLTRIDDLTRREHYYLDAQDECYFFGEYTSRCGFSFSETNQLIANFKKPISTRGTQQWRYKQQAIRQVAELFIGIAPKNELSGYIFVPAPPSAAPTDPSYDDRMYQALTSTPNYFDVKKIICQLKNRNPSHKCVDGHRPKIEDLISAYGIDETFSDVNPKAFVICDDVITNGTTFKAMQYVLRTKFPMVPMVGIFVARRAIGSDSSV